MLRQTGLEIFMEGDGGSAFFNFESPQQRDEVRSEVRVLAYFLCLLENTHTITGERLPVRDNTRVEGGLLLLHLQFNGPVPIICSFSIHTFFSAADDGAVESTCAPSCVRSLTTSSVAVFPLLVVVQLFDVLMSQPQVGPRAQSARDIEAETRRWQSGQVRQTEVSKNGRTCVFSVVQ